MGGKNLSQIARNALASVARPDLLHADAAISDVLDFLRRAPTLLATKHGYRIETASDLTRRFAVGFFESNADIVGILDTGTKTITVKYGRSEQQHVTVNHELAHIILNHPMLREGIIYRVRAKSVDPLEREAEMLAVELSVPTKILGRVFEATIGKQINLADRDERVLHLLRTRDPHLSMIEVARRIAVARTIDETTAFPSLADQFGVSMELMARRLLETNLIVRTIPAAVAPQAIPKRKARILTFCAAELHSLAEELALKLEHHATVELWSDKTFDSDKTPAHAIDARIKDEAKKIDYAMCIFGRDDLVRRNGRDVYMPRHNVVGEAFYCFSQLGFDKTVLIAPEKSGDFEIPSNFDGIEPVRFHVDQLANDFAVTVRMIATKVRKRLKLGV